MVYGRNRVILSIRRLCSQFWVGSTRHLRILLHLFAKKHREAIRWKAQGPREALAQGKRVSCLAFPKTARMNQMDALEGLHRKERLPGDAASGCNGSSTSSSSI